MNNYNLVNFNEWATKLKAGDSVELSGIIYTARDAAHKRIKALIDKNEKLPFEISGATIYYAGPTPTKPGMIIGSCGPTTSSRMDSFTPQLLDMGLCAMIGKGKRSTEVIEAIKRNKALYFCAVGGAGAIYSNAVKSLEVIAFEDLGCESVKRICIENFPVIVGIDSNGNSVLK